MTLLFSFPSLLAVSVATVTATAVVLAVPVKPGGPAPVLAVPLPSVTARPARHVVAPIDVLAHDAALRARLEPLLLSEVEKRLLGTVLLAGPRCVLFAREVLLGLQNVRLLPGGKEEKSGGSMCEKV